MSAEGRAFVDTNVLVYAHDATADAKRGTALGLVDELWESGRGCISIQVLQELFVTLTRGTPGHLNITSAATVIEDFTRWTVHVPAPGDVVAAVGLHERFRLSFWDAMILQSALVLGCDVLYSEDLNSGQRYDGVLAVDPFA